MSEKRRASIRLLMLTVAPRLAQKASALMEREGVPVRLRLMGRGTASREMMDMLGLDSGEKTLLMTVANKQTADALLVRLRRGLKLGAANSGVACAIALSGGSNRLISLAQEMGSAQETGRKVMMEYEYQLIIAIVNQGFSEEVMAAARPAGATGGTVVSGRRFSAGASVCSRSARPCSSSAARRRRRPSWRPCAQPAGWRARPRVCCCRCRWTAWRGWNWGNVGGTEGPLHRFAGNVRRPLSFRMPL